MLCRKVAVPVPDNYTWRDFLNQVAARVVAYKALHVQTHPAALPYITTCHVLILLQVQQKLKLTSVGSVILASVSKSAFVAFFGTYHAALAETSTPSHLAVSDSKQFCRVGNRSRHLMIYKI